MSEGHQAFSTRDAKVDFRLGMTIQGESDQVKSQRDSHDSARKPLVIGNVGFVREQPIRRHTHKRDARDANLAIEEPRHLCTKINTERDLKLAIADSLRAAETLSKAAGAAKLLYEKPQEKGLQCPLPASKKVYAVVSFAISKYLPPDTSHGNRRQIDYEEGEDIDKEVLGLYISRSDANNRVRGEWEDYHAKRTDGDTFGEYLFSFWVDATEEEEGIRVLIEEMNLCEEGSVPPRKWTKPTKGEEGYDIMGKT